MINISASAAEAIFCRFDILLLPLTRARTLIITVPVSHPSNAYQEMPVSSILAANFNRFKR